MEAGRTNRCRLLTWETHELGRRDVRLDTPPPYGDEDLHSDARDHDDFFSFVIFSLELAELLHLHYERR